MIRRLHRKPDLCKRVDNADIRLWPTVIGTTGIVIWTRYYRRKLNPANAGPVATKLGAA